ncbi:MAG: tetratricopeptide repeat protein [Sideroxyarcus sp.]
MYNWFKKTSSPPGKSGKVLIADGPNKETPDKIARLSESTAYLKKGNELLTQGKLEEAADCYRQAIAADPGLPENHLNLGFLLSEQRLYEDAKMALKQAIQLDPELTDAYYLLGMIAQEQFHLDHAIEYFIKTLEIKPDFEIVYRDLCRAYFKNGQYEHAKNAISKGLLLNPEFADFHYYLGNLLLEEKCPEKAIESYQKALCIQPDYAAVYSNMGKALFELGDIDGANTCYKYAVSLDPNDVQSIGCLLFSQSFNAKCSPSQYFLEAKAFGRKVMAQASPYSSWPECQTVGNHSCLRVGMVSGDFKNHPVGYFLESILSHLDPTRIELVAYSTQPKEDELTARIKTRFASWNLIAELSDEAAARKIRTDGIHILLDLSGHTSHNRLPVFAWKPAPVQVSWLGYWASTGVPGIDYLLADPVSVPECHQAHFTETVWYLPDTRLCFTPPANIEKLSITPLPALRNGRITFGCFQNMTKLNDEVLAAWSAILKAIPQARLRIQNMQMIFPKAREQLRQHLNRCGIAPEQTTIVEPCSREQYLAAHAEVDIILDTFPFSGGTTTCESLLMGVPTLTLAGDTMLARQGASLLTCAGLDKWIAHNMEEYVSLALAHAADVDRLAQLRTRLRQQLLASPLFDAPLFAGRLEDALHGMWHHAQPDILSGKHV